MTLPSYHVVGSNTALSTSVATTVAPSASHSANDIEFLCIESYATVAVTLQTANGFAECTVISPKDTTSGTNGTRMTIFWRRWNGSDGSPVVNTITNHGSAFIVSYQGCITSGDPWDVYNSMIEATSDTSYSCGGATTTGTDRLVVLFGSSAYDSGSNQFNGTWTNGDLANISATRGYGATSGGNGGCVAVADGQKAAQGAFGATTCTIANAAYKAGAVLALKPVSSGTDYTQTPSDVEVLSDTVARLREIARTPSDVEVLSDTVARLREIGVTYGDSGGLADLLASRGRGRLFGDVNVLSDLLVIVKAISRSVGDFEGLSSLIETGIGYGRLASDEIGLSDFIEAQKVLGKDVSDLEALSDAIGRVLGAARTATDILGLSDLTIMEGVFARALNSVLSLGSTTIVSHGYKRTASDLVTLVDLAEAVLEQGGFLQRVFTDPGTRSQSGQFIYQTMQDKLDLASPVSRAWTYMRSRQDSEGLADSMSAIVPGQYGPTEGKDWVIANAGPRTVTKPSGAIDVSAPGGMTQALLDSYPETAVFWLMPGTHTSIWGNFTNYWGGSRPGGGWDYGLLPKPGQTIVAPADGSCIIDGQGHSTGLGNAAQYTDGMASGVTVRGGKWMNYGQAGTYPWHSPIRLGPYWVVEDADITGNLQTGLDAQSTPTQSSHGFIARYCNLTANGRYGYAFYGVGDEADWITNHIFEHNYVYDNNTAHYNTGDDAGGSKNGRIGGGTIYRYNYYKNNYGFDCWFDTYCFDVTTEDNVFEKTRRATGEWWAPFHWEDVGPGFFRRNYVEVGDPLGTFSGGVEEGAVRLVATDAQRYASSVKKEFEVCDNILITDTRIPIYCLWCQTGRVMPRSVYVYHNDVYMPGTGGGRFGGVTSYDDTRDMYTGRDHRYYDNRYNVGSMATSYWTWGLPPPQQNRSWAQWQGYGFDTDGERVQL